jgi:Glyoxalase-like domain
LARLVHDAAAQRLVAAGATVRSAPADAGEGGRGAVLTDPEGIEFRIWQAVHPCWSGARSEPGRPRKAWMKHRTIFRARDAGSAAPTDLGACEDDGQLQESVRRYVPDDFSDRSDSENRLDLVLCVADMSATVADALWGGGSGGLGGAAVRLDAVVAEDAAQAIEFAVQLLVFGADGLDVCVPVGS